MTINKIGVVSARAARRKVEGAESRALQNGTIHIAYGNASRNYGAHGWQPTDPGQSISWDAPEAWKFITQF